MSLSRVIVVALMMLVTSSVSAQDQDRASFVPDVVKQVILDPTTWAPSIVAWEATRLVTDAVASLQLSFINNVSERVIERRLMPRYPNHRKLLRTIGWIERSAVASYFPYRLSAGHFRQWQENERRAQQLGYQ